MAISRERVAFRGPINGKSPRRRRGGLGTNGRDGRGTLLVHALGKGIVVLTAQLIEQPAQIQMVSTQFEASKYDSLSYLPDGLEAKFQGRGRIHRTP